MSTFIIAEAAGTHGGSIWDALRLVHAAAQARANACKFQWVSNPERLCERRNAKDYKGAYNLISFPLSWHNTLQRDCELHGICALYI